MKPRSLLIPALLATALFAQGPDDPGPQGPPDQRGRMGMRRGPREPGGPMGMRGWGMGPEQMGPGQPELGRLLSDPAVRQQLGVTADQAAKIRQQESDFRKSEIRITADLQIKRMDLNDLLEADKPDRAAINSKLQEISAAQLALEKSAIDNRLNMQDALTPAQRQRLQQLMTQPRQPVAGAPARGGNAAPQGTQGGGRGRGPAPRPNAPGQTQPNQ